MEALDPNYVASRCIMHKCGQVLRVKGRNLNNFYEKSLVTGCLDEVWSHSWQGKAWHKILTLFFLKNGSPAALVGTAASMAGFWLSFTEMMPSFGLPLWSSIFGVAAYLPTLFLWKNSDRIFLDVGCIHQTNERLKGEARTSLIFGCKKKHRKSSISEVFSSEAATDRSVSPLVVCVV